MSRGLWIEITNTNSPCFKHSLKTALDAAYRVLEISHGFVNHLDILKAELENINTDSKGNQDNKKRCIDVALLVSPPLLMDNEREKLLNMFEFGGSPLKRKILLIDLEGFESNKEFYILDCWKAAERLFFQTGFTHIGLANCTRQQLTHVLKYADKQPKYLQVEASVHFPNSSIMALSRTANIVPIASNVFGKFSATLDPSAIMPIEEEVVKKIAENHHKSEGQILVKHALQRGLCPLIQSNSRTRIIAYSEVDDFELTKEEMHILSTALIKQR